MTVHPSFFIFAVVILLSGKINEFIIALTFIFFHEICHILFALVFKIKIKDITITPIGFVGKAEDISKIGFYKKIFFYLSGPLFNLILALIFYLLDLHSDFYSYFSINLIIGLFNIIPVFPLDGGNIFQIVFERRFGTLRTLKVGIIFSKILGMICVFLGLIQLILFPFNMGLFLIGIFILKYNKNLYIEKYYLFCKKILYKNKREYSNFNMITGNKNDTLYDIIKVMCDDTYTEIIFIYGDNLICMSQNKIMYLYLKFGGNIKILDYIKIQTDS